MIRNLLFNLIIAHILGDFYLQWSSSCKNKILHSVKGKDLWLHSLAIGILSWIANCIVIRYINSKVVIS